jgi:hypothetical protein
MKFLTISILASLALGAAAMPVEQQAVVTSSHAVVVPSPAVVAPSHAIVYEVPGTEYRGVDVIYVDTADTSDEVDQTSYPLRTSTDAQTLIEINGHPDDYSNRDLWIDANRNYDQRENIESDYGYEIQEEIVNGRLHRDFDHRHH